ncbi:MAG: VWA domain-containing protein [Planctomycetota bacterium]|jgi:Ca-activated chloride channel family protein|nr:VWA domain-containing protein [Planctomycetota bacterium]MDP6763517.1 VWA domain-containing protein [Planctomycetota bacterium]MDP6990796.1 VWA domain-containing protein [Planctomycetota bacterium]
MNDAFLPFEVLRSDAAVWLLAAPLVLTAGLWSLRARRAALRRLADERHLDRLLPDRSPARARGRILLACGGTLFAGLALLGPVRGYTLREVERKGLDIVFCIDTSRSMLAGDLKPDRLTRAKREIVGLLGRLKGDRTALLAFAGDVREVAPLTHDRVTLTHFTNTLTTEENLVGGTNLGGALERALALFDGRTGAHEAIVLLTDGEDLEGRGLEMARVAAERGIRVFVVGMGTAEGGKIADGARGFVRDESGREVITRLGGATLEEIAGATGGAYLSAESSAIPLEELYTKRISQLEARDLWAGKVRIPHDRYQWPLVLAVGCLLIEAGLRERRARREGADRR